MNRRLLDAIDTYISDSVTVLNTVSQNASALASNIQKIEIVGVKGNIDIQNINFSQYANIDLTALQVNSQDQDIQDQLKEIAEAAAKRIQQALVDAYNARDTSEALFNLTRNTIALSSVLVNNYTQTCITQATNEQYIIIRDVGKDVVLRYVNFEQALDVTNKCMQVDSNRSDEAQDLWNTIYTEARKSPMNQFRDVNYWFIILWALVFVIVIAVMRLKVLVSPTFYLAMLTVLFLYYAISYTFLGWPYVSFNSSYGLFPALRSAQQDPHNRTIMYGFVAATTVCAVGMILAIIFFPYEQAWTKRILDRQKTKLEQLGKR